MNASKKRSGISASDLPRNVHDVPTMNRRQFLQTTGLATAAMPFLQSAFASSARAIRIDHDGMLCIGSQREFILGLYQAPKHKGALRQASEAGFNLIHRSATRAAHDEAQTLGLWGWSALGSLPATNRSEAEARMRQVIETLRDHPALLFWETEDEPTFALLRGTCIPQEVWHHPPTSRD